MGYITNLESRSYEGRLKPVSGAPAASMASDDGNFALVMHQNSSGSTDGAILYHGTTGESTFFHGIGAAGPTLKPVATTPLAPTQGGVSEPGNPGGQRVH